MENQVQNYAMDLLFELVCSSHSNRADSMDCKRNGRMDYIRKHLHVLHHIPLLLPHPLLVVEVAEAVELYVVEVEVVIVVVVVVVVGYGMLLAVHRGSVLERHIHGSHRNLPLGRSQVDRVAHRPHQNVFVDSYRAFD